MPTSVSASQTSIVLILLSKGDELLKLGSTFTSSTQGLYPSSMITSNPNISKQLLRVVEFFCMLTLIWGSTASRVLTITSLIYTNKYSHLIFYFSRQAASYLKSHLLLEPDSLPTSSSSLSTSLPSSFTAFAFYCFFGSSFLTKLGARLLMEKLVR